MPDLYSCSASLGAGPCADNRKEAQGLGKDGARGSAHIKLLKTTGNKPRSSLCHHPSRSQKGQRPLRAWILPVPTMS